MTLHRALKLRTCKRCGSIYNIEIGGYGALCCMGCWQEQKREESELRQIQKENEREKRRKRQQNPTLLNLLLQTLEVLEAQAIRERAAVDYDNDISEECITIERLLEQAKALEKQEEDAEDDF